MTDFIPRPEDKFSFGLWTVGWQGVDVFGAGQPAAARPGGGDVPAGRAGGGGSHVPRRRPGAATRTAARRRWRGFGKALADTGLRVEMATTNLFSHPVFKEGGFTANNREVRRYALAKVLRNIDLAAELGAETYVMWGGREGAEHGGGKNIRRRARPEGRGSNMLCDYVRDQGYDMRFALEPKPNEPRGDILLPTIGHALALHRRARAPRDGRASTPRSATRRWPGSTSRTAIAQALWHGKLFHIDLNGQHGPRFDQDLRFGAGNLRGAFWTVDTLLGSGTPDSYDGYCTSTSSPRAPRRSTASGSRRGPACATT